MMHFWGLWIEGGWVVMESLLDSLRPMQVLNALIVASLVTLYTLGRDAQINKLFALWVVNAGLIVLWLSCVIALHHSGM